MLKDESATTAQCGATLITNNVALTAAHCVFKDGSLTDKSTLKVRLGEHNIKEETPDDAAIDFEIESIIKHPKYNVPGPYSNDIAILRLKPRVRFSISSRSHDMSSSENDVYLNPQVDFNERISPVCLPYDSELFRYKDVTGIQATITGWGQTSYNGRPSDVLRETSFRIVSSEWCKRQFQRWVDITDLYICAGNEDSSKDSCQGDSGGPLVMLDLEKNRWYLMGIVSFGRNCAQPGYPGVYTRVSKLLDWIENNI